MNEKFIPEWVEILNYVYSIFIHKKYIKIPDTKKYFFNTQLKNDFEFKIVDIGENYDLLLMDKTAIKKITKCYQSALLGDKNDFVFVNIDHCTHIGALNGVFNKLIAEYINDDVYLYYNIYLYFNRIKKKTTICSKTLYKNIKNFCIAKAKNDIERFEIDKEYSRRINQAKNLSKKEVVRLVKKLAEHEDLNIEFYDHKKHMNVLNMYKDKMDLFISKFISKHIEQYSKKVGVILDVPGKIKSVHILVNENDAGELYFEKYITMHDVLEVNKDKYLGINLTIKNCSTNDVSVKVNFNIPNMKNLNNVEFIQIFNEKIDVRLLDNQVVDFNTYFNYGSYLECEID